MRITFITAALATGLLGMPAAGSIAAADQSSAATAVQADPGYGARSLRGLKEAWVEVVDAPAVADDDDAQDSKDDAMKLLQGLLGGGSGSTSRADKIKADVSAALGSRTAIKLRSGTAEEARAANAAIITVRVTPAAAGGKKPPYDVTLSVQQPVALLRDRKLHFYATTYETSVSEPADGRGKRKVAAQVTDQFIELWRAAN
jgi:hypothetical protein